MCACSVRMLLPCALVLLDAAAGYQIGGAPMGGHRRAVDPAMKWEVNIAPWELAYGLQKAPVTLPASVREGDPPQPFTVTEEQRAALFEDGAIVIPGVLNKEWIEYARGATDWQVRNPHFWSIAGVASGLYDYLSLIHI